MVNAPIILTTATQPLPNTATAGALSSDDVSAIIVQTDVDTRSILNTTTNNLLIGDNPSTDELSIDTAINITRFHPPSTIAEERYNTTVASSRDSINENNNNNNDVKLNGNRSDIGIPSVSSPTSEQSTQTDDDDENSSICSSTNSIKQFVIEHDEQMDTAITDDAKECGDNDEVDADFVAKDNVRDGDVLNDNSTNKAVLLRIGEDDVAEMKQMDDDQNDKQIDTEIDNPENRDDDGVDDDEQTYCVGHFYGQDEEDDVPEKPPDVGKVKINVTKAIDKQITSDNNSLQVNNRFAGSKTPSPDPVATVSIPVPIHTKSFTLQQHPQHIQVGQHAIPPQIIGIAGMIAQQPSSSSSVQVTASVPPSHHHHPHSQQQQPPGTLLQPLHLATLNAHTAATVNQQISPNAAASTSGASTPIHHHHHCLHHPHVHLHSPGHQPSSTGASSSVAGAPGHPHTHIIPLQVISLAQAPGTAGAAAGTATAWPLVEAPVYVDVNGEYRTYCPAHPQGPPPREHRVLLQLDAGVSLPVQIAGKRKVFRGESFIRYSFCLTMRTGFVPRVALCGGMQPW